MIANANKIKNAVDKASEEFVKTGRGRLVLSKKQMDEIYKQAIKTSKKIPKSKNSKRRRLV